MKYYLPASAFFGPVLSIVAIIKLKTKWFQKDKPELCKQIKRSKQKSGASPKLGPSPRMKSESVGLLGSNLSLTPVHTPELDPTNISLEPSQDYENTDVDGGGFFSQPWQ